MLKKKKNNDLNNQSNEVNNFQNDEIGSFQNNSNSFTPLNSDMLENSLEPSQNGSNPKKKFNLLFIIIPVILVIVLVVGFLVMGNINKNKEPVTPPVETQEPVKNEGNNENIPVDNEEDTQIDVKNENKEDENKVNEEPNIVDENKYAYENDMLGIKFNYDSNLYIKENVEEIFNTVKAVLPEGRDVFNIYSDKLTSLLNVAKLTTGDADGLYISVSIVPFEINKETTTLKIDGTTEVKNESIEAINLTDEELIANYDVQIQETIKNSGCEIISFDKSVVSGVGSDVITDENGETKKLKGIFTSRVYSGPEDVTSNTGMVDVLQCTIPVGKNAIVITAVTDGREIEIDKSVIFNQIVNSLIVTTEGPLPEVIDEKDTNNVENKTNVENRTEG